MRSALCIVSGGMDSVTLAYDVRPVFRPDALHLMSFNYGQRHKKELDYAVHHANKLGARFDLVDLSGLAYLLKGSALTDDSVEVPEGHYAEESMRATIVPNRNAMMLAIAYAAAVSLGAEVVAAGFHAGDHWVYPDCRPEFVDAFATMERLATESDIRLYTPWMNVQKSDIALRASELGVNLAESWSCYKGGDAHCGRCGTCVERIEAFQVAGITDPTAYEARA